MNLRKLSLCRRRADWLGLAIVLTGSLLLATLIQGGDASPPRKESQRASALAAAEVIIRGPEEGVVGTPFTVEVYIVNNGKTPLTELEFVAQNDAALEQVSKAREHREKIEAIYPDDLHIVRLTVTPRKVGSHGVDFTLRTTNGDKEQVRQQWPISPEGTEPRRADKGQGTSPLQFKVTPLKDFIVGKSNIVLIQVQNTDFRPMEKPLKLIVSHSSVRRSGQAAVALPELSGVDATHMEGFGKRRLGTRITSENPTRQLEINLPALGIGEGRTLPIRIRPRRIGDLGVAISAQTKAQPAALQVLATARLQVRFDPNAAVQDLLPLRAGATVPARLPQKLADVPEVALENLHAKGTPANEGFEHIGHLIEKINHVNKSKRDAYIEALTAHRSDLRGLPFTLGDDCRLPADKGRHFLTELDTLRTAMTNPASLASGLSQPTSPTNADATTKARIAALIQVVPPEGTQLGQQMVKFLASSTYGESTTALAKLAIFAEDDQVRRDALAALATRRSKEVDAILLSGLNYPWPAVAQRAGEAIVKLERKELATKVLEALERPDPRLPELREKDGKQVTVVRELVRINHFRNCLLCHAPASPATTATTLSGEEGRGGEVKTLGKGRPPLVNGTLTAPVPLPGQPLPTPSPRGGYGHFTVPDTLVDFGVTYLRQDFSVKLSVADAQPWPEHQRFDFLVRTREVTEKEAQSYRTLLKPTEPGELTPYQRVAVATLKQLTGREAEPNADAWRRLLERTQ